MKWPCSSSVTKSCLTLWDPMDCSTPGFSVLHYLSVFAQTQIHRVGDVLKSSHPLLPLSSLALNLSEHQGLYKELGLPNQWPNYWSFNINSDYSDYNKYLGLTEYLGLTGLISLLSKKLKSFLQYHNLKA